MESEEQFEFAALWGESWTSICFHSPFCFLPWYMWFFFPPTMQLSSDRTLDLLKWILLPVFIWMFPSLWDISSFAFPFGRGCPGIVLITFI